MKFYSYVLENDHLKEIEESMDDYSKEREEFMKKFFPKKNEDDFTIPFVNSRGEYGYPLRSRFYKKRFKELSKKYELKKIKITKHF